MIRLIILAIIVGLANSLAAPLQAADDENLNTILVWESAESSISAAAAKLTEAPTEVRNSSSEVLKHMRFLVDKWRVSKKDLPQSYLKTLQIDAEQFVSAANTPNAEESIATIKAVASDFTAKAALVRGGAGAGSRFPTTVKVRVLTQKNGKPVQGFLVRCNPWRYKDNATPLFPFNNPTNDAEERVPAGHYRMWLEKPAGTEVCGKPVNLGLSGEPSETVKFDLE